MALGLLAIVLGAVVSIFWWRHRRRRTQQNTGWKIGLDPKSVLLFANGPLTVVVGVVIAGLTVPGAVAREQRLEQQRQLHALQLQCANGTLTVANPEDEPREITVYGAGLLEAQEQVGGPAIRVPGLASTLRATVGAQQQVELELPVHRGQSEKTANDSWRLRSAVEVSPPTLYVDLGLGDARSTRRCATEQTREASAP